MRTDLWIKAGFFSVSGFFIRKSAKQCLRPLTCGSGGHVPVGHPSSVLVVRPILGSVVGHALLVGGPVDGRPGRVGHLGDGSLWAVQSPRGKPGGTGHNGLLGLTEQSTFFFCFPAFSHN